MLQYADDIVLYNIGDGKRTERRTGRENQDNR